MIDEPRFDPLDYVSVFQRRKWWFIVPVAASVLVGAVLVWALPRTYESTATIGVSSPRVSPGLLATSTQADRTERLRAIQQQLLSRNVLEQTAKEEGLAAESSLDAAVARMRARMRVAASST